MSDISGRLRTASSVYDASYPPDVLGLEPDPHITTLTPNTVSAAAAATTVTIAGSNFEPTSVVEVNGAAQPTTFVSPTSLTISYDPTVAGTVTFTVRNVSTAESNSVPFVVGAIAAQDVSGWSVEEGKQFVIAHPALAAEVASLEREGKNRPTLLAWLDDMRAPDWAAIEPFGGTYQPVDVAPGLHDETDDEPPVYVHVEDQDEP